jgi:hypothetical protein
MAAIHKALAEGGHLDQLRRNQAQNWFWSEVQAVLTDIIAADPRTADAASRIEADVIAGRVLPHAAARDLIAAFRG